MFQASLRAFLLSIVIIVFLLMAVGLIRVKADGYACAGGWNTGFQERVEVFHYGPLHVYAFPFTRECPEDRQFDPNDVDGCVNTSFCRVINDGKTTIESRTISD